MKIKKVFLCVSLFFGLIMNTVFAQSPSYNCEIKNDFMVSETVYEFDIYMSNTGSVPLEMANFQAAISVNSSFVNGGSLTAALVDGFSELNLSQVPTSIGVSSSQNCIKIAPKAPPRTLGSGGNSTTDGTLISETGTRLCRISLTNSVPFGAQGFSPSWNFTVDPYRTVVSAFVGPANGKTNTLVTLAEAHSNSMNLKLFAEGLYDPGTSGFKKVQDADGENSWDKFAGLVCDTLSIQLAESADPWNIVYSARGININSNGTCRVPFPATLSGNYYVIVKHRNSVETWSKAGGESLVNGFSYDFTTSANQAFGGNMVEVEPGVFAIFAGDVNSPMSGQDGYVDGFDVASVFNYSQNGGFGYIPEDLTGDGFVDGFDVALVFNGSQTAVGMNTPPNPL